MNTLTDQQKIEFKANLKDVCSKMLMQRISTAQSAMQHAQDSANNEDKSSAGDKYETARAMGQLDRDMNAKQLNEAQKEYTFLQSVNTGKISDTVSPGTVVCFDYKVFFIAVGLGSVLVGDQTVIALSAWSPLYNQLKQKRAGDEIVFQNKKTLIDYVF